MSEAVANALTRLSEKAAELHNEMMNSQPQGYMYKQPELQEMVRVKNINELMRYVQELTDNHLVKLSQDGKMLLFSAVSFDDAAKIKGMSQDEALIYFHIEESGRDGIWTKVLHGRTNLHHNVISRCLKSLEAQRYIKQVKSVKNPTRKIYMLASIEPSVEMSGGPWFTDSEIDTEFIDNLLNVIWRYTVSLSFPSAFKNISGKPQETFPASYRGYPTVSKIHNFVADSGITNVELSVVDIRSLCEVLVYDGRLERVDHGYAYKATWQSVVAGGGGPELESDNEEEGLSLDAFSETPCGRCPVIEFCGNNSRVNPAECIYLDEWLDPSASVTVTQT